MRFPFLDLETVNRPYMADMEAAMAAVCRSGRYVGGQVVADFEANLADFLCRLGGGGVRPFVVGVSNGLDALRLSLRAFIELHRLAPGDEVIVPANTYIASVLAISDLGLIPVLAEPSEATLNLDTSRLEEYLSPRVRAVMPVHLYGRACWDDALRDFALRHNLLVIEDNAQAIGAVTPTDGLNGCRSTGTLGHAGAFSFYPTKNLGAMGDAGAVVTFDPDVAAAVRALANYGSDRRYHNIYRGYNCRMDPLQAAILNVKLPDLEAVNAHRRQLAAIYSTEITNPRLLLPTLASPLSHVYHQYVLRVPTHPDHLTTSPSVVSAPRAGNGCSVPPVDNGCRPVSHTPAPSVISDSLVGNSCSVISDSARSAFLNFLQANEIGYDIHYATPPHLQPCYAPSNLTDSSSSSYPENVQSEESNIQTVEINQVIPSADSSSRPYSEAFKPLRFTALPITERLAAEVVSLPISTCTTPADAHAIAHLLNRF